MLNIKISRDTMVYYYLRNVLAKFHENPSNLHTLQIRSKWMYSSLIAFAMSSILVEPGFIKHTSQLTSPGCPQRFAPSFQDVFLGTTTRRAFNKMPKQSRYGPNRCNAQCCESSDCLLSFSEGGECYSVSNPHAARNMTMHHLKPRISVQIAIIDRNKGKRRQFLFFYLFFV